MGRGAVGPPSRYSRSVAANIDRLRKEAGLAVGELISRAGLTKSYYQSRASLQLPFNTNDIEALAAAIGVTPGDLASPDPAPVSSAHGPTTVVASRVRHLVESHAATEDGLLEYLGAIDPRFAHATRELLRSPEAPAVLPEGLREAIAQWADVHPRYLLDPTDESVADRTDAELELRAVMRAVGASSIQFRAQGEMSPEALRAIATSLRARPAAPETRPGGA